MKASPFFVLCFSEIVHICGEQMRKSNTFHIEQSVVAKAKLWASMQHPCVILDSHSIENVDYPNGSKYDVVIAYGEEESISSHANSFQKLREFYNRNLDWIFGYLSYDLKNELEDLHSGNEDFHGVQNLQFFIPQVVVTVEGDMMRIHSLDESPDEIYRQFDDLKPLEDPKPVRVEVKSRIHHSEYIRSVQSLLHHIQIGDIYEANYCQEFYNDSVRIQPYNLYRLLIKKSPTPFSVYLNLGPHALISASPERYIQKQGNKITSQPIKGTINRGENGEEDEALKLQLYLSKKDRTENVMIVDLVRNDLSKIAASESVKVDELYGVYSFSNVHQMISTISCDLRDDLDFVDVLEATFPMGSMTGAPKIMAMKLIEKFEHTKRGMYSGAVGYVDPNGDFDFNVVIRSIQYQSEKNYLSYMVGGAITHNSTPEEEFKECEVKARAIKDVLGNA